MTEITRTLSAEEARALTNEVQLHVKTAWRKLVVLYECEAHLTLGYASWAEYCREEFSLSRAHAYRMVQTSEIVKALEAASPNGRQVPTTERAARELAPLRGEPGAMSEAWDEVVESCGPTPTAEQVRNVVAQRKPPAKPKKKDDKPKGWLSALRSFSRSLPWILRKRQPPPERIAEALRIVNDMRDMLEAQLASSGVNVSTPSEGGMTQEEWIALGRDRPVVEQQSFGV